MFFLHNNNEEIVKFWMVRETWHADITSSLSVWLANHTHTYHQNPPAEFSVLRRKIGFLVTPCPIFCLFVCKNTLSFWDTFPNWPLWILFFPVCKSQLSYTSSFCSMLNIFEVKYFKDILYSLNIYLRSLLFQWINLQQLMATLEHTFDGK